jgi:hypothetical protein
MGALLLCVAPTAADFYVSPQGSDAATGGKEDPFTTLERARDAIRAMKQDHGLPQGGVTVWLRGGDHLRVKALELAQADSGTPDAPIVWQAYPGEKARLLGGRVITGFEPVTDPTVLGRLSGAARDHVLVADLRSQGLEDYGKLRSRGFGRSAVSHGELFFAGKPMTLARWPNEGQWDRIASFAREGAKDDGHGTTMGALEQGFHYSSERPGRWQHTGNIWIHGYWAYDWANSYERVAELDAERRFVRTAAPYGNYGFHKNQRLYWLNILEELDSPGEWFVDRETGLLYFWPPAPLHTGEALFSLLEEPLIRAVDASHVVLRGLALEAVRGDGIVIAGGENIRVVGCLLRNVGNWAIRINSGTGHAVASCDIFDTGDGGVSLSGGDRQRLALGQHQVENCHFARQGRWSRCYVPAVQMSGVGMRAANNLIHDHPHCAILFSGNEHLIEFNEIHDVARETGDVGIIYAGRDYTMRGNRIRHNYLHHVRGPTNDARGVYMDDCVSGTEVYGNIFYKVHWAMFIGGGRDHHVINNLFVDCDPAIVTDARGLDTRPVWRNMVNDTMRGGLKRVPLALYRERYPAMKNLDAYYGPPDGEPITGDDFKGIPPEGNVIARNACVGDWIRMTWMADPMLFDIRDNFVTNDLAHVGGPETGFRLPKDSPAWNTGFQPILFDKIGLQNDEDRTRLEHLSQMHKDERW